LHFYSVEYGSEAFVSVKKISGGQAAQISKITNNQPGPAIFTGGSANVSAADRDTGADVTVLVNGAVATGRGLKVTVRNPELDLALLLSDTFATNVTGTPTSFNIIGGGATFQLGPQVTALQQTAVGIDSLAATRLGGTLLTNNAGNLELQFLSSLKAGGENDLTSGNLQNASAVLETAIDEVSSLRGRLGAFERNVLQTNVRSLQSSLENISASESVIRDADFAKETSELTRSQILVSAGTAVLATANTNAQSVLQLLG
jgi:flagellin